MFPVTMCMEPARACEVVICITIWFTAAVFIEFANKHLLDRLDFSYPFFLVFCTNTAVACIAWVATHHPELRQPTVPTRTYVRVVVPLGIVSTLDLGFSNWSLVMLDVAFHVIIKGAAPLAVLLCGICLRIEALSVRTALAIVFITVGLTLVASDRLQLPDRPLGIVLGLISVGFTGVRWVLTQLLLQGASASKGGAPPRAPAHPLASMVSTMPVIAAGALTCVLILEREVFITLVEYTSDARMRWLLLYLPVLCSLVFAVVFVEFRLVQRTSSLTVAVIGVFKELFTVGAAVLTGDQLSPINALGLALCIAGNALYFCRCSWLAMVEADVMRRSHPWRRSWCGAAELEIGTREEAGSLVRLHSSGHYRTPSDSSLGGHAFFGASAVASTVGSTVGSSTATRPPSPCSAPATEVPLSSKA
jgi:Triose-phosphate Transporter family